ncbi:MAG: bifunctional metallophosphatase/5'-nucleotidase [Bacteroidales bacterium]|jgi:2',3'-cyclic-nucleotide 2'-phosphodiesterase/3'-nucleotidase|nr:bifunctional metallophosphatase/5'-nucleotidase [Bacteroidales bacterium]
MGHLRSLISSSLLFLVILSSCGSAEKRSITIIETTDIHGVIMPYDYIENEALDASLAHTASLVREIRSREKPLVLLDNGDNLQGQPSVYYYNYIDTSSFHILTEALNWIGFDAGTVGNHDIEAGHRVYDRLRDEYNFPLLAANAVDVKSGEPYFTPFTVIEKGGIRVAVLGLITPAVPTWLPEELYRGIRFTGMVEAARQWMPEIQKQKPDLVIGLFHSGWDREETEISEDSGMDENGVAAVAWNVPGFDIIFCGHDHRLANEKFANSNGDSVLILNGGSRSANLAIAEVTFRKKGLTGRTSRTVTGKMIKVSDLEPDREFMEVFAAQHNKVKEYVSKVIGYSGSTITSRDSYFGPSAFVDMIHRIQLEITGADISFAAPLSFDVQISKGPVTVSDMFKLYRFENMLYTMELTGAEIKKYLEYSYAGWLNTMKDKNDYMLDYRLGQDGRPALTDGKAWLRNQPYNFESAAGLNYTVDASKPDGNKVSVKSLSDGRKLNPEQRYRIAVNSYRGNGGGGHLTEGAGISAGELMSRVVASTDRDLRYYIMKYIEEKKTINPVPLGNWKIVPSAWTEAAAKRERILLFGKER